jgi:CheY-like chemotaxis protein
MTLLLEEAGLRVHSCSAGAEALELVDTVRPDLVLLDLGLGDMSGLDVTRQIRLAGHTDLRIIAATGYSDAGTMAEVLSAGFNGRLVKPISLSQIMAELPPTS